MWSILFIIEVLFYYNDPNIIKIADFIRKLLGSNIINSLLNPLYNLLKSFYFNIFKSLFILWILIYAIAVFLHNFNEKKNWSSAHYINNFKQTLFYKFIIKMLTKFWMFFKFLEIIVTNSINLYSFIDWFAVSIQIFIILLIVISDFEKIGNSN